MTALLTQVRALVTAQQMIAPGPPVVVAVSGGPDSLCLLHVLAALRADLGVALHVAHLDHMIRGAESAAEAQFVAELARRWGLPATIESADVPGLARAAGANLHAAARAARYGFLARVAHACGAQAVAVAHHADDQAETVLMHLLRGAGPEGLRGMRPVVPYAEWAADVEATTQADKELAARSPSACLPISPALIRPLLQVTRADIESYCAAHGLDPRRDPSNQDLAATRNRIRHDLLPRLIEYNPHVISALGRTAAICAEEQSFVDAALAAVWAALAREREGGVDFAGAAWRELHPALQRAAIRRAHAQLGRGATLGMEHVEQARALVGRGVGGRADLPGGVALVVGYDGSFTLGAPLHIDSPQLGSDSVPLPAEGHVDLGEGWAIEVTRLPGPPPRPVDRWEVYLDAAALGQPLLARRRRPGDRLRPAGGRGGRRLQDLLVDAKLPRALRDAWPIVATPSAIVWVAGLRAAEGALAGPHSREIVKIRFIKDT